MADRFDPESDTYVDKFADGTGGSDAEDTWRKLVAHLTGYPMPKRSTLFEKLTSDHGGPMFRMDIRDRSLEEVLGESGFEMNDGEDYDIWFFTGGGGGAQLKQARIVFEGTYKDADGNIQWADTSGDTAGDIVVGAGAEFTDYNDDTMSNAAVFQYMNGPRDALIALFNGGTFGMQFGGLSVPAAGVVDLKSFDATGDSFDRAAKFFKDYATIVKGWEDALGKEDAVWQGTSAEVFRGLLSKVRENYEGYVDTFNGSGEQTGEGQTVYSRALSQAKAALRDASQQLLDAWQKWAQSPYYEPIRVLRYVLDDLARWVEENNIKKTDIYQTTYHGYQGSSYSHTNAKTQSGFTQVHPTYGDLSNKASWKKVGEEAVRIWTDGVDEYLGKPAADVESGLNNTFLDLGGKFTENVPEPQNTTTEAEDYAKEQAKKDREDLDGLGDGGGGDGVIDIDLGSLFGDGEGGGLGGDGPLGGGGDGVIDIDLGSLFGDGEGGGLGGDGTVDDGPVTTESLGDLGGINGGSDGTSGPPVVTGLGNLGINGGLRDPGNGDRDNKRGPFTRSLGDLGGLNDIGGGGLETPTGGETSLADGNFDTTFLDGSSTSFDPGSGVLTSTGPDGSSVATDLTHGASVTNPDGSVTKLENGQLTTSFPDGSRQVVDPETGRVVTTDPQGHTTTTDLGDLAGLNDIGGGGFGTRFPDGSSTSFDLGSGVLTSTGPDGSSVTTDPQGHTTTTGLGDLGGLSDIGGVSSTEPGGGGDATTQNPGLPAGVGSGLTDEAGPQTEEGGSRQGGGSPGMPMMPMGGMGGMGGMGAGGGDSSHGERVRAVLTDSLEESRRRNNRRRRGQWDGAEEEDTFLAPASRPVTTSGREGDEEAGPAARPRTAGTSSSEHLEEEEDVWGTDEGGAPVVIGR